MLGSVGAVALAMRWGFDVALLTAALLYVAAVLLAARALARPRPPPVDHALAASPPIVRALAAGWLLVAATVILALAGELG